MGAVPTTFGLITDHRLARDGRSPRTEEGGTGVIPLEELKPYPPPTPGATTRMFLALPAPRVRTRCCRKGQFFRAVEGVFPPWDRRGTAASRILAPHYWSRLRPERGGTPGPPLGIEVWNSGPCELEPRPRRFLDPRGTEALEHGRPFLPLADRRTPHHPGYDSGLRVATSGLRRGREKTQEAVLDGTAHGKFVRASTGPWILARAGYHGRCRQAKERSRPAEAHGGAVTLYCPRAQGADARTRSGRPPATRITSESISAKTKTTACHTAKREKEKRGSLRTPP